MNQFIQYELQPIEVRELSYGYNSSYYSRSRSEETLISACALLIVLAIWGCVTWRLPTKAGYSGISRWIWFGFLALPLTTVWALLAFVLVPSPKDKELKVLKAQLKLTEDERDSGQQQINRNVEYIKQANLKIQSLQNKLIQKG